MIQSLRERKKERTRHTLVAAGMRLFAERGFQSVTVADIAAEADIATRTFHRYFPDKVELLFARDQELRETVRVALEQDPPGADPVVVMRSVLTAIGAHLADHHAELVTRDRLLMGVPVLRNRELAKRAATEQLVAEHLARRLGVVIDQDVRPRWWAGVAFATFTAGYQAWLAQGGELSAHLASAAGLLDQTQTSALP
jgi:AcrR family transcriptional regulator